MMGRWDLWGYGMMGYMGLWDLWDDEMMGLWDDGIYGVMG